MPAGHFIRPRAIWYDDKSGSYTGYVDYMRPHKQAQAISRAALLTELKDGWALEDGQLYNWDVSFVRYMGFSDHYDQDHYDYYTRYLPNFLGGTPRERNADVEEYWATRQEIAEFEVARTSAASRSFDAMVKAVRRLPYLRVLRAVNCNPELLWKMERRFVWSDLLNEFDADTDNIFTSTLILVVKDQTKFFDLLTRFPIGADRHFRASRVYVFLPGEGLSTEPDELLFDVKLMVSPAKLANQRAARVEFNSFFDEITAVVGHELGKPSPQ